MGIRSAGPDGCDISRMKIFDCAQMVERAFGSVHGALPRGLTTELTSQPMMAPAIAPSNKTTKNCDPIEPPMWPNEKIRIDITKPSKPAAKTEQIAPVIIPTITSLTRIDTCPRFSLSSNVSFCGMHEELASPEATYEAGRRFARTLRPGDAVAFAGDLGAGKTTFIRGIVAELCGSDTATSPTFTFWHRYGEEQIVNHLDLYRIEDPAERLELGLEDAFSDTAITLVEWPERLADLLPPRALRVSIVGSGDEPRIVSVG